MARLYTLRQSAYSADAAGRAWYNETDTGTVFRHLMTPRTSIIAAIGRQREIGAHGGLLWHIPGDMAYFRSVTAGKPVMMGRRTYDSLPPRFRPLPGRTNIVLQRADEMPPAEENVVVAHTIDDALAAARRMAEESGADEVFVIGGGSVYAQALPYADRLYLTVVDADFPDADTFFPPYEAMFPRVVSECADSDDNFRYTFVIREK